MFRVYEILEYLYQKTNFRTAIINSRDYITEDRYACSGTSFYDLTNVKHTENSRILYYHGDYDVTSIRTHEYLNSVLIINCKNRIEV